MTCLSFCLLLVCVIKVLLDFYLVSIVEGKGNVSKPNGPSSHPVLEFML